MACKIKTITGEDSKLYTELEKTYGTKVADDTYEFINGNDFKAKFGNWELYHNFNYIKKNLLKPEQETEEEAQKHVDFLNNRFGPGTAFYRAVTVAKSGTAGKKSAFIVGIIKPRDGQVSYAVNSQGEPELMYMIDSDFTFSKDSFVFSSNISKAGKFSKPEKYEGKIPMPIEESTLPVFLNVKRAKGEKRDGRKKFDSKKKDGDIINLYPNQVILATQGIAEDTAEASDKVPELPETTDEAIIRAETEGLTEKGKKELEDRKKLANRAVGILKKKLSFYKKKEGKENPIAKTLQAQINKIQLDIVKGENASAIMSFLEFAYSEATVASENTIPEILTAINDPKATKKEKRLLLKKLARSADYLSAFDLVEEIYGDLQNKTFSAGGEEIVVDTAFRDAYISPVITTIRSVKRSYISASKDIIVDFLMEYNTDSKLTSDRLRQMFTHVNDDISWFQANLDSLAESPDQVLALVDRAVSSKMSEVNYNIESFKNGKYKKVILALEKYKKSRGISITNHEKMYDFMVEKGTKGQNLGRYIDPKSKIGKELSKPEQDFLEMFHELYSKHQKMLPPGYRRGYQLIPILKSGSARAWEDVKGFKSGVKAASKYLGDQVKMRGDETEYGEVFVDEQGKEYKFVPINYAAKIGAKGPAGIAIEDVSMNMGESLLQFMTMAKNYSAMNSILVELEATKALVGDRRFTKKRGSTKLRDRTTQELVDQPGIESYAYERLSSYLSMVVYGEKKMKGEEWAGINTGKAADLLMKHTSLTQLSLNLYSGINNSAIGQVMNAIEGAGGQFYRRKDYLAAKVEYTKLLPQIIKDSTSRFSESWLNLFMEQYDIFQEFDQNGKPMESSSKLARIVGKASYFLQSSGEHMIQSELTIAMMKSHRLINGEIINHTDWAIANNKAINKKTRLEFEELGSTVRDLIEIKDGAVWTKETVKREQLIRFTERIKGVYQRLHGNYSKKDQPAIQRYALGRLALLFRKWLRPGFNRRYASATFDGQDSFDQRLGANIAGNYAITYQFLKQVRQELKGTGIGLAILNKEKNGWSTLPEWKKQGIKRTLSEISFLIGTLLLITILGAPDDDDDDLVAATKNMLIYQAYRLKSEMLFYLPSGETLKILRSPSAAVSTVEKLGNALWYTTEPMWDFGNEWMEYDIYTRGKRKGTSKAARYWYDLVPYANQIKRLEHTKESARFMQNLGTH